MSAVEKLNRLKQEIKRVGDYARVIHYSAGAHPAIFYPLHSLFESSKAHDHVKPDTDIVIEGFPRSGNTFAVLALKISQPRPIKTADHIHVPSQIMRAARYGIPACVLVREPNEVVRSLVVKKPYIRIKDALRGYARFYEKCLPYRDHFVVATFGQVTVDFGVVVDAINAKFGAGFARFEYTTSNVLRVFELLDKKNDIVNGGDVLSSYRPNSSKDAAKEKISFSDYGPLLFRCQEIFHRYEALATRGARSTGQILFS